MQRPSSPFYFSFLFSSGSPGGFICTNAQIGVINPATTRVCLDSKSCTLYPCLLKIGVTDPLPSDLTIRPSNTTAADLQTKNCLVAWISIGLSFGHGALSKSSAKMGTDHGLSMVKQLIVRHDQRDMMETQHCASLNFSVNILVGCLLASLEGWCVCSSTHPASISMRCDFFRVKIRDSFR